MDNIIANNIKKYRLQKGFSQKELAQMLNISNSRLSNWEQGTNKPPADTIGLICSSLGISASELLGLTLAKDELNHEERIIIENYRAKKEMHHSIKVLLGIEQP